MIPLFYNIKTQLETSCYHLDYLHTIWVNLHDFNTDLTPLYFLIWIRIYYLLFSKCPYPDTIWIEWVLGPSLIHTHIRMYKHIFCFSFTIWFTLFYSCCLFRHMFIYSQETWRNKTFNRYLNFNEGLF